MEFYDIPQMGQKQTDKSDQIQYSLPRGDNDEIVVSYQDINNQNNNTSFLSQQINFLSQSAYTHELELDIQNNKRESNLEQNRQNEEGNSFTLIQEQNPSKSFYQECEKIQLANCQNQNKNNYSQFKSIKSQYSVDSKNNNYLMFNQIKDGNHNYTLEKKYHPSLLQNSHICQSEMKYNDTTLFDYGFKNQTSTFVLPQEKQIIYSSNRSMIKVSQDDSFSEQNNETPFQQINKQQEHKKLDSIYQSGFKSQKTAFSLSHQNQGFQIYNKQLQEQKIGKRLESHIKKFVNLLKNQKRNRSAKSVTQKQRNLINDYSDFTDSFSYSHFNIYLIDKSLQIIYKFVNNTSTKHIIMPTDSFKIIWDTIQIIANFIFLYAYSIFLIFAETQKEIQFLNFSFLLFIAFLIFDIIINLNSSYYQKDQIITKRALIFYHYLKSFFFIDLICLLSSIYSISNPEQSIVYNPEHKIERYILNYFTFFRIFGVYSKRKVFDNIQQLSSSQRHLIKLINQLIFMISMAHIMGIFWYLLALYQQLHGTEVVWLSKYNDTNIFWFSKYTYSFYWAVTTMTTGYGDITPSNSIECLFCALSMIVFSCIFAYSINNIGMILEEINRSSKKMNENTITMQRRNVNSSLRNRIKQYLYYLGQETKDKDKNAEEQVISILSNKLRDELTQEVNTKMLKTCSIFYKLFSQSTLQKIVRFMKEIQVYPNECIFNVGEVGNQALYFVLDGEIEMFCEHEKRKTVFNVYRSNQYFGEYSFFTGFSRIFSARSLSLSTLFYLPREDFLNIIRSNSEDLQRYKMLQEQICVNKITSGLNVQGCASCGSLQHFANECSQTHLVLDSQFIALKNNYFEFQSRNVKMKRKRKKSFLSYPLNLVSKNKEQTQILIDKITEIGGISYERIKIYSNQDSNDEDEDSSILKDKNFSSDGETKSDLESILSNFKQKELKFYSTIKSNQFKENIQPSIQDSSVLKTSINQGKDNFHGNGNQQHTIILKNPSEDSEFIQQTVKTSEKECQDHSLTCLEKRQDIEDFYNQQPLASQNESFYEIKNSSKKILKQKEDCLKIPLTSLSQREIKIDPSSAPLINLQNSIDCQLNDNQPTKAIYLKKSMQYQTSDNQVRDQQICQGAKLFKASTQDLNSPFFQTSTNTKKTKQIYQNNMNKILEFDGQKELIRLFSRRNCVSKRQLSEEEQMNDKFKQQTSLLKLLTKLDTSNLLVDENVKDFREQREKKVENLNDIMQEDKIQVNNTTQMAQQLKQPRKQSHIIQTELLQQFLIDILQKNNQLVQENSLLGYSNNLTNLEDFDKMQIFSKFFPHNNIDKIISKLKQKKLQSKQNQKPTYRTNNRRQNIFQEDLNFLQKEIQQLNLSLQSQNQDNDQLNKTYNPTILSYGIFTKRSRLYPKRINSNIYQPIF